MTRETDPAQPAEVLSPLSRNYLTVEGVIASLQLPFRQAIEAGDGFEPYHAAEIAKLDEMGQRINYFVWYFGVEQPVNEAFVVDMIGSLDMFDYSTGAWPEQAISSMRQAIAVDEAIEAASQDASELSAAA